MTGRVITTPSDTRVDLQIPCECGGLADVSHLDNQCGRGAQIWVVMHDVFGDCRTTGVVSLYLCHGCWDPLAAEFERKLRWAATSRHTLLQCASCGLHVHLWSDLVYRVVPVQGVA